MRAADYARYALASMYIQEGEYEKAQNLIDCLPEENAMDKRQLQISILMKQKEYKEAARLLEQSISASLHKANLQLNLLADAAVKEAKNRGLGTFLATNPVFPCCATMNRIRWAGLDADDFGLITTYEDYSCCKPNIEYFRTVLDELSLDPAECLMVGNDVEEDLVVRDLGVKTYLVTDTMENRKGLPIRTDYMGSLKELVDFVRTIPER